MDVKAFIADIARPWVLWAGGGSASIATVLCARAPTLEGAAVVAAAWGGIFGIYWGKAQETAKIAIANAQASAEVEKERAKSSPLPAEALASLSVSAAPWVFWPLCRANGANIAKVRSNISMFRRT